MIFVLFVLILSDLCAFAVVVGGFGCGVMGDRDIKAYATCCKSYTFLFRHADGGVISLEQLL